MTQKMFFFLFVCSTPAAVGISTGCGPSKEIKSVGEGVLTKRYKNKHRTTLFIYMRGKESIEEEQIPLQPHRPHSNNNVPMKYTTTRSFLKYCFVESSTNNVYFSEVLKNTSITGH